MGSPNRPPNWLAPAVQRYHLGLGFVKPYLREPNFPNSPNQPQIKKRFGESLIWDQKRAGIRLVLGVHGPRRHIPPPPEFLGP